MQTILVLFGGCSTEYEVSLQSAHGVLQALDRSRFTPLTVGITREGRQLHPHCTRYTFATRAKAAGVDDDTIKRTMGHTDFALTSDVYIQDDIQRLKAELLKLK